MRSIRWTLLGLMVVSLSVGRASVGEGSARQEEQQIVYDRYCGFIVNEAWHTLSEVASTVTEADRVVLLQMAIAEGTDMQLCSWTLLSALGDVRVVPIIAAFIANPSNSAAQRDSSCEFIKSFATVDALPAMLSALSEPLVHGVNSGLHRCAIAALGSIDHDDGRERLRALLDDPAYDFARYSIIEALGRLHDIVAVPRLSAIARDSSEPVGKRQAAVEALARIGTPQSIEPILSVVEALPPGQQRWDLCLALTNRLEEARERAQDSGFRQELQELVDTLRVLGKELPVPQERDLKRGSGRSNWESSRFIVSSL